MVSSWHMSQYFPNLQDMEGHLDKHRENISILQAPKVILESSSHKLDLEQHGTLPFSLWLPASQRWFLTCLWVSQSEGSFPEIANFALFHPIQQKQFFLLTNCTQWSVICHHCISFPVALQILSVLNTFDLYLAIGSLLPGRKQCRPNPWVSF